MSLDEHMLIYFIDTIVKNHNSAFVLKNSNEQRGTRHEIEAKLLEFLYNLKYYSNKWIRARLYARIVGIMKNKQLVRTIDKMFRLPSGLKGFEAPIPENKIGEIT